MADPFVDALKLAVREDARTAFAAAYRQMEREFAGSPPGSVRLGVGSGGRVPRDTGALQGSWRTSGINVSGDVLSCTVDITARNNGFDYPAKLNRGHGRSGRYRAKTAASGLIHKGWWGDWLGDGSAGGDRWGRVLEEQFGRIG